MYRHVQACTGHVSQDRYNEMQRHMRYIGATTWVPKTQNTMGIYKIDSLQILFSITILA